MLPQVLLHGALGRWDEVILLGLLVAFLLSLAWYSLTKNQGRNREKKLEERNDTNDRPS